VIGGIIDVHADVHFIQKIGEQPSWRGGSAPPATMKTVDTSANLPADDLRLVTVITCCSSAFAIELALKPGQTVQPPSCWRPHYGWC
jgi:hypothetical protein